MASNAGQVRSACHYCPDSTAFPYSGLYINISYSAGCLGLRSFHDKHPNSATNTKADINAPKEISTGDRV